jgi:hypothetical protein
MRTFYNCDHTYLILEIHQTGEVRSIWVKSVVDNAGWLELFDEHDELIIMVDPWDKFADTTFDDQIRYYVGWEVYSKYHQGQETPEVFHARTVTEFHTGCRTIKE